MCNRFKEELKHVPCALKDFRVWFEILFKHQGIFLDYLSFLHLSEHLFILHSFFISEFLACELHEVVAHSNVRSTTCNSESFASLLDAVNNRSDLIIQNVVDITQTVSHNMCLFFPEVTNCVNLSAAIVYAPQTEN